MIAIGICIDNQERLDYPIDFITRHLDRFDIIFWFIPNELQRIIMLPVRAFHPLREKINIVILKGNEIKHPDDISKFQNEAMRYMGEFDFRCILRADVLPSQKGIDTLFSWVNGEIYQECNHVTIQAMMCKLYCEMWGEQYVLSAARKGFEYHSFGDGGAELHTATIGKEVLENSDFSISRHGFDLGYFSFRQYYRKCLNHDFLWPDIEKKQFIQLVDDGKIHQAVERALKGAEKSAQRKLKIFPKESQWYEYVKLFRLEEEYELVNKILNN